MKASVYLAYGKVDELLYVGITGVRTRRFSQHRLSSEWWEQAERLELEHYPTRSQALSREAELILERQPPFNRVGLKGELLPKEALFDLRAAAAHVKLPMTVIRRAADEERLTVAHWEKAKNPHFHPEDLDWWMRQEMERAKEAAGR